MAVHKVRSRFKGERESAYYTLKTRQDGTYLYLYNDVHKKFVTVTGVFENPLEVQYFPDCEGNTPACRNPQDMEFILDPDILTTMYDLALAQIGRSKQVYTDDLSNSQDDIAVPVSVAQQKKNEQS